MSEAIHHRVHRGSELEDDVTLECPEPEKRLMLAVLRDAVACLESENGESNTGADSRRAARQWIMAKQKGHLFCFESICEALNWNADQIRTRLLSSHKRDSVRRRKKTSSPTH